MRKQATRTCEAAVLVGALALVSGAAMAQTNSASATVSAVVVAPITVSKAADMAIGNLVAGNGVVTLNTAGVRTKTGGAALSTSGPTPTPARFTISGAGANTFSISYSGSSTALSDGSSNEMAVDFITEVASAATGKIDTSTDAASGTLTSGTATLHAGAAVTVNSSQAPGTYTGTLAVTVAYN